MICPETLGAPDCHGSRSTQRLLQANHPWLSKIASYFHVRPLFCRSCFLCTDALHCMPGYVFIRSHQAGVLTFARGQQPSSVFDTAGRNIGLCDKLKQQIIGVAGWEICIGCLLLFREHPGIWILYSPSSSNWLTRALFTSRMANILFMPRRAYRIYVHVKNIAVC